MNSFVLGFWWLLAFGFFETVEERPHETVCTFGEIKLYGKVEVVESFPDLEVQIVDSFPDLRVQKVSAFPDECGEWEFVENFADFQIQFVDNFPDIKIQFVKVSRRAMIEVVGTLFPTAVKYFTDSPHSLCIESEPDHQKHSNK